MDIFWNHTMSAETRWNLCRPITTDFQILEVHFNLDPDKFGAVQIHSQYFTPNLSLIIQQSLLFITSYI